MIVVAENINVMSKSILLSASLLLALPALVQAADEAIWVH